MLKIDRIGIRASFSLNKWHLFALLFSGSLVRIYFGIETAIWNKAHDQIAWEIPLHELFRSSSLTYKQLVNYPHEGGTVFLSLLSFIFLPFVKSIHVLSIVAFLMDLASRWIQIHVAKKLFGDLTALYFGLWTIFALPLMLPWGLAFFGLHNSSVWLFVFVYMLFSKELHCRRALLIGSFVGLAVWFSYHNMILIPAFMLALFVINSPDKFRSAAYFLFALSLTLLPHVLLRSFADHGFPFEKNTLLSAGRPSVGDFSIGSVFQNFTHTALYHLPDSLTLFSIDQAGPRLWRSISLLLVIIVLLSCFIPSFNKRKENRLMLSLVVLFLFAFSTSSMFIEHMHDHTFYSYRHFAFVCPLLFFCFFASLLQLRKYGQTSAAVLIFLCIIVTANYFQGHLQKSAPDYKVAGWIITRKYGNDVGKLLSFQKVVPAERQTELMYGFGWGLAVHNLYEKNPDTLRARQLVNVYEQFPDSCGETLLSGLEFAFQPGITPTLNPEFKPMILTERTIRTHQ